MAKPPKPCIDVCKYRLGGHCIACSMTKAQKKASKKLGSAKERAAFIAFLKAQQAWLGRGFKGWENVYRRKCAKKGVACPLDAPTPAPRGTPASVASAPARDAA